MEKERVISLKEGNRKCKKGRCDHPITNGPIIPTHPAVSVRPLPIPSGSGPSPHLACRAGQCRGPRPPPATADFPVRHRLADGGRLRHLDPP